MTETDLNIDDKSRLKADIKISLVIGLLFTIVLVVLVGLVPGIMFLFGKKPSDGFMSRCLFILGLLFLPFLIISWTNVLKYFDLRKGKKNVLNTENYELVTGKDNSFILTSDNAKQKIKISNEIVKFIKPEQPLTIEICILSKLILFISHDSINLIDKFDNGKK